MNEHALLFNLRQQCQMVCFYSMCIVVQILRAALYTTSAGHLILTRSICLNGILTVYPVQIKLPPFVTVLKVRSLVSRHYLFSLPHLKELNAHSKSNNFGAFQNSFVDVRWNFLTHTI